MNDVPTTLAHLYVNADGPFRSIVELPEAEALRLMDQMTGENTWHPSRFSKEQRGWYMAARRRSEQRLHAEFVRKDGCPRRQHPYYLFLDTPGTQDFYPDAKRVRVRLDAIPSEVISFTYLDSMVCDALLHDPDRVPPNCRRFAGLRCLSEVYRLEELPHVLREFGLPEGTYLEAQVWDDEPLKSYREQRTKPVHRTS